MAMPGSLIRINPEIKDDRGIIPAMEAEHVLIDVADIEVRAGRRPIDEATVAELAESIEQVGLLHPLVVTTEHQLVAGAHRLRAVAKLGWTRVPARVVPTDLAALIEIDENLVCNDLSVLEQGEHLLRREQLLQSMGRRAISGDNQHGQAPETVSGAPVTTKELGSQVGLSARTVQQRMQVARKLPEKVRDAIRGTPVADRTRVLLELARVRDQAELPSLVKVLTDGRARSVPEARGVIKHERRARLQAERASTPPPPEGPYGVLVIDPPWEFPGDCPTRKVGPPYPSMTVAEIAALPVDDLADHDAVVWLWTTNLRMLDAHQILAGWGFEVKTILTWAKSTRPSPGHWLLGRTEHVLLGVRGKPPWARTAESTMLVAGNGRHSAKPTEFYEMVERICPDGRRLEMFARKRRPGWKAWGLEAPPQPSEPQEHAPSRFHVHESDAMALLRTMPEGSVDCIVTDPPYESLEKHRKTGTTTRLKKSKGSSNRWFPVIPNSAFPALFAEMARVLAKDAHLYLYCDQETMFVVRSMAEEAGFKFWKALIWDKKRIGMGYHYRARHEVILFFEKGKRKLNDLGVSDVIEVPRIKKATAWPTEKPPEVSSVLISQSTGEGDVVLDPFMGSGSVGVAAARLGRHFIGGDIEPEAVERTRDRLLREGAEESAVE